jgi:hypothetical protein
VPDLGVVGGREALQERRERGGLGALAGFEGLVAGDRWAERLGRLFGSM